MDQRWLRAIAAVVVFVVVSAIGVVAFGRFDTAPDPATFLNQVTADSWALILTIGMIVSAVVYFGLEYAQTGRLASIAGQFTTRTIVLMPVAIAINIVLGTAVASALKIPIYLDSIGTILVGVLAGPVAGALTGAVGNILWSYVIPPPFQYPPGAAFAVVAVVIGIIAGFAGRLGFLRPRLNSSNRELAIGGTIIVVLILVLSYLAYLGYRAILGDTSLTPQTSDPLFVVLGWIAIALVVVTVGGLLILLAVRRDLSTAYVVVTGVVTGIIAALISAPIAAGVFGGVTASGTDFLVAALRQGGADVQAATLGQGLISDPIDKVVTFFVVYLIISAMPQRTKARFPQGEQLLQEPAGGSFA
jgi:hypothetical protein